MGGWSLYVKDGAPRFAYNFLGREIYKIAGPARLPAGRVTLRFEFAYDGGKPGAGGNGAIFVNGEQVAAGRIEHTHPFVFGAETTDVGENLYTCVSDDYKVGNNRFTGKIRKVTVQVGKSNLSEEAQRAIEETAYEESAIRVMAHPKLALHHCDRLYPSSWVSRGMSKKRALSQLGMVHKSCRPCENRFMAV